MLTNKGSIDTSDINERKNNFFPKKNSAKKNSSMLIKIADNGVKYL